MKKLVLFATALVALPMMFSCGPNKAEVAEKARQDSIRIADSIKQVEDKAAQEAAEKAKADSIARDQKIADFISDMFNNRKFENEKWLRSHCTKKMLAKLAADYEYDGEGLAFWNFRSDAQDMTNSINKVTEVTPLGEGWYKYDFIDYGVKGSHNILIIEENNGFMIDGLK